jgi:glycosyltransferase involved in cell wall biosynthesis
MNDPLVSVVVPLYNGGAYIESTLRSVLSQSYGRLEIIVVDDGSTDQGPATVSTLVDESDGSVRLIRHDDRRNHGIAASRNLAIRTARGELIAFVDQDDRWLPEKLEREVQALRRFPEAGLVYAKASFIDQHGSPKAVREVHSTEGRGTSGEPRRVFGELIKENFIPTLTALVRKSLIEKVGFLDEGPRYEYEDWLLFSKIAFFSGVIFVPEVLAEYRVHKGNYSAYLAHTGQLYNAEEHYTITLFTFLMRQPGVRGDELRGFLRRRIWYFFVRSRSWGMPSQLIEMHTANFLKAFPSEERTIHAAARAVRLVHPAIASRLRRLRRNVVGI